MESVSSSAAPLVSIVDDDQSVRESLPGLLRALGFEARALESGLEFLASDALDQTDCLVLDVAMPGMTGPELQVEVSRRRKIPIIFITGNGSDALTARLLDGGAVRCL